MFGFYSHSETHATQAAAMAALGADYRIAYAAKDGAYYEMTNDRDFNVRCCRDGKNIFHHRPHQ